MSWVRERVNVSIIHILFKYSSHVRVCDFVRCVYFYYFLISEWVMCVYFNSHKVIVVHYYFLQKKRIMIIYSNAVFVVIKLWWCVGRLIYARCRQWMWASPQPLSPATRTRWTPSAGVPAACCWPAARTTPPPRYGQPVRLHCSFFHECLRTLIRKKITQF